MIVHPPMERKMKTFVNPAFPDSLYDAFLTGITDKHRCNERIHMAGTDMKPPHAILINIIAPFFKKFRCEMRNVQNIKKFFTVR